MRFYFAYGTNMIEKGMPRHGFPPAALGDILRCRRKLFSLPRIDDDRKILHRNFDEFLRPMPSGSVEEQRVTLFENISSVGMAIANFAR